MLVYLFVYTDIIASALIFVKKNKIKAPQKGISCGAAADRSVRLRLQGDTALA